MTRFIVVIGAAVAVLAMMVSAGRAQIDKEFCMPQTEQVGITLDSQPYVHGGALPAGYLEEEFFISCTVGDTPYKTIVHVRRPIDESLSSGRVVVEIWHWGDTWTVYPKVVKYLARHGDAIIIVAASPLAADGIKAANPTRYADLSVPWKPKRETMADLTVPQEFTILSQVGRLIKSGGIPGLNADYIILAGMSGSSGQVRRYIAQEGKTAKWNGVSVFDGYFPAQTAVSMSDAPIPDLAVPVIEVQGETELIRSFQPSGYRAAYRRSDGPLYRLYEVPGMSHIPTRGDALERPHGWDCGEITLSNFPHEEVYAAALDNLFVWVTDGTPAPHASRIETSEDGSVVVRDEYGNAKGGVRTSYLDVPTATYHVTSGELPKDRANTTMRCDMIGNVEPLSSEELRSLYASHEDYVMKVNASLDQLVAGRWYLPEDAEILRTEAESVVIP